MGHLPLPVAILNENCFLGYQVNNISVYLSVWQFEKTCINTFYLQWDKAEKRFFRNFSIFNSLMGFLLITTHIVFTDSIHYVIIKNNSVPISGL